MDIKRWIGGDDASVVCRDLMVYKDKLHNLYKKSEWSKEISKIFAESLDLFTEYYLMYPIKIVFLSSSKETIDGNKHLCDSCIDNKLLESW